jgi:hypothetical protein
MAQTMSWDATLVAVVVGLPVLFRVLLCLDKGAKEREGAMEDALDGSRDISA